MPSHCRELSFCECSCVFKCPSCVCPPAGRMRYSRYSSASQACNPHTPCQYLLHQRQCLPGRHLTKHPPTHPSPTNFTHQPNATMLCFLLFSFSYLPRCSASPGRSQPQTGPQWLRRPTAEGRGHTHVSLCYSKSVAAASDCRRRSGKKHVFRVFERRLRWHACSSVQRARGSKHRCECPADRPAWGTLSRNKHEEQGASSSAQQAQQGRRQQRGLCPLRTEIQTAAQYHHKSVHAS